ncbi:cytochrome b-c1 complex subunit 9 [Python bivittatus]|uniref:Complex III subunit 9 n=1 Tax=Python bivittatus TaxID=176946 RepID=A0A9F2WAN4_PYTBI|nr:cytochrome b-c1 complex subunit 9 [Python bivittatus]
MAFAQKLYRLVFRRTSTLVFTVVVGAVIFERGFDQITDNIFYRLNEGKLWKDIKHKYELKEE